MKHSESIKEIASAMRSFQASVGHIQKTATNPFFKSTYAPLSEILDTIREPLAECGLSFMQFPKGENELETIVMHTSGEWIRESYTMVPTKNDPQGRGSAITYQKRYAIVSVLGLNTGEEDDDGNRASEPIEPGQRAEIQKLCHTAEGVETDRILEAMDTFTATRAQECISYLRDHQPDRVAAGSEYNQGDIQKKLDKVMTDESK